MADGKGRARQMRNAFTANSTSDHAARTSRFTVRAHSPAHYHGLRLSRWHVFESWYVIFGALLWVSGFTWRFVGHADVGLWSHEWLRRGSPIFLTTSIIRDRRRTTRIKYFSSEDCCQGCDWVIRFQLKFFIGSPNSPITSVRFHASVQLMI